MMATAAATQRPPVPRLTLPSTEAVVGKGVESPTFRRQINVALGRMHSQRTPRRDAVFHIEDGGMVEKHRQPLATAKSMSSRTTAQPGEGGESTKYKDFCTTLRYMCRSSQKNTHTFVWTTTDNRAMAEPVFFDHSLVCMSSRQSISQSSRLAVSTHHCCKRMLILPPVLRTQQSTIVTRYL